MKTSLTYTQDAPYSFFGDLYLSLKDEAAPDVRARLVKHDLEMRDVKGRSGGGGAGFIPPAWLTDEYSPVSRAPRPLADAVPKFPMPPAGIDSVKYPKLTGGASVGVQANENDAASETDITSSTPTGNQVVTIAGQQDVSRQVFLRTLPGIDEVIFEDLMRAYDAKLESQLYYGAGANGEHVGIDGLSSSIAVTYTQGTPDQQSCFQSIAKAVSQVCTQRFVSSVSVLLHPRRAAWLSASSGTASLSDNPAFSDLGIAVNFVSDPSIATNKGAGTNEDRIYVVHTPTLRLAESSFQLVMPDVLSGTATVRLQLYTYSLFLPDRDPKAVATISGTGLVGPSGF